MSKAMTFSQALRLADEMGIPDLRRDFIEPDVSKWGGEVPPCCAIGGANIASRRVAIVPVTYKTLGGRQSSYVPTEQQDAVASTEHWRLPQKVAACPGAFCAVRRRPVLLVMHLYDQHQWSRTEIADWIDGLAAKR